MANGWPRSLAALTSNAVTLTTEAVRIGRDDGEATIPDLATIKVRK
jgi:hypothetical protein